MNIISNILLVLATVTITPITRENTITYDNNAVKSLQVQANSTCNTSVFSKQRAADTQIYQTQLKVENPVDNLQLKEITVSKLSETNAQTFDIANMFFNKLDNINYLLFDKNDNIEITKSCYLTNDLNIVFGYYDMNQLLALQYDKELNAQKIEKTNIQIFENTINKVNNIDKLRFNYTNICKFESIKDNIQFDSMFNSIFLSDTLVFNLVPNNKYGELTDFISYDLNLLQQQYLYQPFIYNNTRSVIPIQQINVMYARDITEDEQLTAKYLRHNITKYIDGDEPTYVKRSRFDKFDGEYGSIIWYLVRIGKRCEEEGNIEKADKYYNELLNVILENTKRKYIPIH